MAGTTLGLVIAIVLLLHGIGHAMGMIPALGLLNGNGASAEWLRNLSSRSWLLTDLIGNAASRVVCFALFAVAGIGFAISALALPGWLVPHDWWRTLAISASIVSLVALALCWNALIFLFPHKIGYIAVDVAVLICLLWVAWPTEALLGR